jgi:hypothetical protein
MNNTTPALQQDDEEGSDYTLNNNSCWISVKDISIYIQKLEDRVEVTLYGRGKEDYELLPTGYTSAIFNETVLDRIVDATFAKELKNQTPRSA